MSLLSGHLIFEEPVCVILTTYSSEIWSSSRKQVKVYVQKVSEMSVIDSHMSGGASENVASRNFQIAAIRCWNVAQTPSCAQNVV